MAILPDITEIQKHFPDAHQASDGAITFACSVCQAEGHANKSIKLYGNGALSCVRFAAAGTEANRQHCQSIAEQLGIVGNPSNIMIETIAKGAITLEAKSDERGKVKLTARNGTGILHLDTFNLADAGKRAIFVKALALDEAITKEASAAMLRLADRCDSVNTVRGVEIASQIQAISFKALDDGRLIEQLASGFAVYDGQAVSHCHEVEDDGISYRPLEDSFIGEGGLLLPDRLLEYQGERELDEAIDEYIKRNLDLSDRDRKLSAAYIRLTYLFDKILELPYLRPIGQRGNGKSRFVSVVGGICYRPVTLISPSAASLFRIVDRFKPTLIVDEANFNEGSDDTQALMQILNAGYQRIAKVPRAEGNNGQFEVRLFDAYCPKLIASLKTSDSQAFESRCIQIQMEKTRRKDIRLRLSNQLLKEQAELRAKLTLWRLRNWHRDFEDLLDQAEAELKRHDLEPRYIQVSTPLFALITDDNLKTEFIKMVKGRDEADAEERKESFDGQLVTILHGLLFEVNKSGDVVWREDADRPKPEDNGDLCLFGEFKELDNQINGESRNDKEKRSDGTRLGRKLSQIGIQTRQATGGKYRKQKFVVYASDAFARLFRLYSLAVPPEISKASKAESISINASNALDLPQIVETENIETTIEGTVNPIQNQSVTRSALDALDKKGGEVGETQKEDSADFESYFHQLVALDTETERFDEKHGITHRNCRMIGLALSYNGQDAEYVTDKDAWLALMPQPEQTVIFHNAKLDLSVLSRSDLPIPSKWEDTIIAAHLLDENGEHGLKPLATSQLGINDPLTFEEADRMRLLNPEVFNDYAKNDARYTFQLWQQFQPALERQGLMRVYELEKQVTDAVLAMETTGIKLDLSQMAEMSKAVADEAYCIEQEIYDHAGCRFDLNSPKKVAVILYDKLNVPSNKQTANGQRSVDREALEEVRGYHPTVDALLRYREIDKLASTFLNVLPKYADNSGRIHPEFKPLGAKTGRFSCSNPNVQQIPSRSELGKKLRQMFIAEEGHSLVVADWSQMELRILAHYSQDPLLLQAYTSEHETDLHTLTAARMFRKAESQVTKEERAVAKMINFGIAYGITPIGLFNRLKPSGIDVTQDQCERFIKDYFCTYPKVRKFLDEVMQTVRKRGYVKSLYGRRRRVAGNTGREIRQAQNFIIQASAADLAKAAMVRLHQTLPDGARLVAMVHDEFIVECRPAQTEQVKRLMEAVMSDTPDNFTVPMLIEAKSGDSWGECK